MARVFTGSTIGELETLKATPANRLLSVPPNLILERKALAHDLFGVRKSRRAGFATLFTSFASGVQQDAVNPFLSPSGSLHIPTLRAVFQNPTDEEIDDIAFIERFFKGNIIDAFPPDVGDLKKDRASRFNRPCAQFRQAKQFGPFAVENFKDKSPDTFVTCSIEEHPFFSPPSIVEVPPRTTRQRPLVVPGFGVRKASNWPVDGMQIRTQFGLPRVGAPQKPWGEVKPLAKNIAVYEKVHQEYPWPRPTNIYANEYRKLMLPKLNEFVRSKSGLTEVEVKDFITPTLLDNFDKITARVQAELKAAEERAKERAVFKQIAFGALALVSLAAGGAGILLTGIKTTSDVVKQRDVAKNLRAAADEARKTDADFGNEIQRFSDKIDAEADAAEKRAAELIAKAEALEAQNRRRAAESALPVSTSPVIVPQSVLNAAVEQGAREFRDEEARKDAEGIDLTIPLIVGGVAVAGLGLYFLLRK